MCKRKMEISKTNDESATYWTHHCKKFIPDVQQLPISNETMERASKCGFNISDFVECCLKVIGQSDSNIANDYDSLAKIAENFADAAIPFLKRYQITDVEVARLQLNDTREEFTVYLSVMHGGYIIVKHDEKGEPSVRTTNASEIWRYLAEPCHIIQAVISAIIAYAEKHNSIKNDWLFTLEDINEGWRLAKRNNEL
jgi:hypothetical protein